MKENFATPPEQLSEFKRQRQRPIVFCVKCGSLEVEQNSVNVLLCLNCRNQIFWNGRRFAIAREAYAEEDAVMSFTSEAPSHWRKDWHFNIVHALWAFSDEVIANIHMTSIDDPNLGKSSEEYEELVRAWNKCKEEIDVALSRNLHAAGLID